MSRNKRTSPRLLWMAALLLVLVLITFWLLAGMLARYRTADVDRDEAHTADLAVTVTPSNRHWVTDWAVDMEPGCEAKTVNFSITTDSEVDTQTTLTLEIWGNLPLEVQVDEMDKMDGDAVRAEMAHIVNTVAMEQHDPCILTWPLEPVTVKNLMEDTETFRLTVKWAEGEENKDFRYENGVAAFKLKVETVQID